MIMKINQRTIPKTFSVNYGKSNPLNKIKFRNRILSKGSVMFLDNSTQKEEKIKKKIEKENAANEIKIYYSNNNTKLNHLNYRNFSINQYSIHPRKEQKIGEETFKDKLSQFTNSIEFKPFVDHLKFIMKKKETLRPVSKSIKESSSNSISRLCQTGTRMPNIYRKMHNRSTVNIVFDFQDEDEIYEKRYEKPQINIDEILMNYNTNAKRSFSCEKIKPYQMKMSPFAKQHKFVPKNIT